MEHSSSRRSFMSRSALATTGIALLSSSTLTAFSKECPYKGYNPYAEFSSDIRKQLLGEELEVKGVLLDKDRNPVPDTVIEIWHLSPQSGKYRHRTKVRTNESGEYSLLTDFPAREEARTARVYFKISRDRDTCFAELALDKSGGYIMSDYWEANREMGDQIFPKSESFLNRMTIQFNISI